MPGMRVRRLGALGDLVGVLALLALAVPMRLVNLEAFVGKFDEGIRGEQLLLMSAGFRPFRDIFASQGPLSLDIFYPTFALFGQSLAAARLTPAILSIAGLFACGWAARLAAGPVAAGAAVIVLLLSPTYLKNSRLALVEIPALVPALAAVGAGLAFQRRGERRWLVASGLLVGLALLIKPMVVPAVAPITLASLLRASGPGRPVRALGDALLLLGVAAVAVGAVVLAVGPVEVYEQLVRFRLASRQIEGWSLKENWSAMAGELADEQLALYAAAAAAAAYLLLVRPRLGLPLAVWPLASFGLLMVYSPLQFKHAVIMIPPLALLVGVGVGQWAMDTLGPGILRPQAGRAGPAPTAIALASTAIALALALWYAASLPAILSLDRRVMTSLPENRPDTYDDEIELVGAFTAPSDFILVDEPSVAFAARRLVPPALVDTSSLRIRSRTLGAGQVIAATERYDVKLLFLFSDGLRTIRPFADWVDDHFLAVKINERRNGKDRALYLRQDADLGAARAVLERALEQTSGATFGGQLRLLGFTLERGEVRPGGSLSLTLGWQAIGPVTADYHVVTILRDARGQIVEQNERSLGGGGEGTAAWEPGRFVFRATSLGLRSSDPSGDYRLSVGLYDSRARQMLQPDGVDVAELELATVRVRS